MQKNSLEKKDLPKKQKIMEVVYFVLLIMIPILFISVFPWAKLFLEFRIKNIPPSIFEDSYFTLNLYNYFFPLVCGLLFGAGLIFLGINVSKYASKLSFWGCLIGLIYALLLILSYLIMFNINLGFTNIFFGLVRYTGTYTPALILGIYGPLLYKIIKEKSER